MLRGYRMFGIMSTDQSAPLDGVWPEFLIDRGETEGHPIFLPANAAALLQNVPPDALIYEVLLELFAKLACNGHHDYETMTECPAS